MVKVSLVYRSRSTVSPINVFFGLELVGFPSSIFFPILMSKFLRVAVVLATAATLAQAEQAEFQCPNDPDSTCIVASPLESTTDPSLTTTRYMKKKWIFKAGRDVD